MGEKEKRTIWVVTQPDGRLATGGQSVISESHALAGAISHWLPSDVFGNIDYGFIYGGGVTYCMWRAMQAKGWKILEVEIPSP